MPTRERLDQARVRAILDGRAWAHATPRTRALGWDFAVRTDDAALGRHLDDLLREMAVPGDAPHWYSLLVDRRPGFVRHRLYRDGKRLLDTPSANRALMYLLWDINQRLFVSTPDKLLVHAAVTELDGRALVMSAPSESGKTTLTVGLVEAGMGYLTDEAAAFDPHTLLVHAFPKALSVDTGAQPFLERFRPAADPAVAHYLMGQWQVTPESIRPGATTATADPAWILIPRYVRGGTTELLPVSRAETLALLMEQGLNLHHHGGDAFRSLAEVVRRCRCFHLAMADLPSAVDTVMRLVEEGPAGA